MTRQTFFVHYVTHQEIFPLPGYILYRRSGITSSSIIYDYLVCGKSMESCTQQTVFLFDLWQIRLSLPFYDVYFLEVHYWHWLIQGSFCVWAHPMSLIGWAHRQNDLCDYIVCLIDDKSHNFHPPQYKFSLLTPLTNNFFLFGGK